MKNFTMQESKINSRKFSGILFTFLILTLGLFSKQTVAAPIVITVDPFTPTVQAFDAAAWTPASPPIPLTMPGFTVTGATSITWNSDNLLFYGIIKVSGGGRHLAIVDPGTGVCTEIGLLSSTSFSTMTYNSDAGIMYMMGGAGGPVGVAECLFSVDLTTAATTFLAGPFSVGSFGEVIAYNYDDDLIYHWSGEAPAAAMETIDPVTFAATLIPPSGMPHSEVQGAVYTGAGSFVVTDLVFMGPTMSFTITSGGFATLIGPTPFQSRGLAYIDPLLPVELSSFVSTISGSSVTLNWATASETNNSGFDIERSSVNGTWSKIGNVSGNGTSAVGHNYTYTDKNLSSGIYNYRLKQIDFNGNFEYFNLSNEVNIGIPVKYDLSQNYPNPFNPSTSINYDLPVDGNVSLKIFDMSGKELMTLVNEVKTAGYYSVNFNASDLSSGVYFYTITADNFTATKKMMLLK
ncbi:MAG: T9SS type A sorting domain-containing protein [Ignavibacteria bacterium]|nr:T9SS type A sorting domain-containing protein [Ignavibacteria bacterium]